MTHRTGVDEDATSTPPNGTPGLPARAPWLTGPCPSWCRDQHTDLSEAPADRAHVGPYTSVPLTSENYPRGTKAPIDLMTRLEQGYREIEARVCMVDNETETPRFLTLDEAERLVENLTQQIRQGRGEA